MRKIKILIIGGDSEIGRNFSNLLLKKNVYFNLTSKKKSKIKKKSIHYLDLKNLNSFDKIKYREFTHALITIGISSIDYCQKNQSLTNFINVEQIKILINKLTIEKIKIIYLSSDKVFDEKTFLNNPSSSVNPKSVYGKQKIEIERYLKDHSKKYIILRLSKVISNKNNLINKWIKSLKQNNEIYTFNNETISPIRIEIVVNFLYHLLIKNHVGIFHLSAQDTITYYKLALILAKKNQFDKTLIKSKISKNKFRRKNNMPSLKNKPLKLMKIKEPMSLDIVKYFYT